MLLGVALLAVVRRPVRPTGSAAVRGHRVFDAGRVRALREIAVTLGARTFVAHPREGGWEIDGRPADAPTADALNDLRDVLADLRAVDVFRPGAGAGFGLDPPRATITVGGARPIRLALGDLNAASSALYARCDGDPRVMQVGTLLLSQLERVFYQRDRSVAS